MATLRILLERLFRLVPQPFAANAKTGEREAESPDFISVREALVNLLIHQDYSDVHRTARILWFRDAAVFENPGDSFASISRMLDGGSSEVRNPTLVRLLRQAGFAEQAGSGIPKIVRTWRGARRLPPTIENDPGRKVFRLTLDWEPLASKRDELWYRRLGVEISEDAGRLLTFARTAGAFDLTSARLVTGLSGRASVTLVSQLVTQHLVEVDETDEETVYKLAPRLEELWEKTDAPAPGRRAGTTEGMTEGISEGITDRKARLADMIRERPGLRGPQLSVALNLPASTVDRYLSQLRKAGLIEHRGARRTGGYFPRSTKRK